MLWQIVSRYILCSLRQINLWPASPTIIWVHELIFFQREWSPFKYFFGDQVHVWNSTINKHKNSFVLRLLRNINTTTTSWWNTFCQENVVFCLHGNNDKVISYSEATKKHSLSALEHLWEDMDELTLPHPSVFFVHAKVSFCDLFIWMCDSENHEYNRRHIFPDSYTKLENES